MYKPHPHEMAKDNDHIAYFMREVGLNKDNIVHTHAYRLLAEKNISKVVGLSSSLLYEAKYLGKNSKTILNPWWNDLVPISAKTFLSFDFWRYCLSPLMKVNENVPKMEVPYYHSMLRKLARTYWGYDILDKQ